MLNARRIVALALCALAALLTGCASTVHLASKAANGDVVELSASLSTPAGSGPFPAIVMMHGCGGLASSTQIPDWSAWFKERGYAVMVIDSFTGRGLRGVCGDPTLGGPFGSVMRVVDAQAAIAHLRRNPKIDSKRLVLIGFSHGALSVLVAAAQKPAMGYAGYVALYPACSAASAEGGFSAPTMILVGDKDDWTPAEACRALLSDSPGAAELHVYPGAYHAFDRPDGPLSAWGHMIGYNAQAYQQSHVDMEQFLRRLRPVGG